MTARSRAASVELLSRAVVAALFLLMAINLTQDFLLTRRLTGLLLLVSESLVVVFTIFRRPAETVDRSMQARIVTLVALLGPPLLRTSAGGGLAPDMLTAMVSSVGTCLVLVGKITLGRSFGIVPANRGVVARGPYLMMRHPIYTGYMIAHLAFIAAHPTVWNIALVVVADCALVVRALMEERVLSGDQRYREYCARVNWHLVPGVF